MKRAAESTIIQGERGLTIDQKLAHRHITNEEMDQLEREVNNCTNHACISMQLLDSAISDLLQRQSQSIELFKLYASMGCNDDKSQMAETIKNISNELEGLYEEKKRNRKTVTSKLGSVESQLEAVQRKKFDWKPFAS